MALYRKIAIITIALFLFFPNSVKAYEKAPKEWLVWLDILKKEMISKGINEKTIQKAYKDQTYYHQKPEVVQKDKEQTEFILTSRDYVNKLVNEKRVGIARKHYKKLQKKYQKIEEQYGVPLNYLTAFWAIETNFGQNKGKYHIIDGLTNLSYKNRRSKFFKNELYNVLKIMEKFELENDKMMGSWAGAMGHFQFMPSTYNAYAIDYDNDGVIDTETITSSFLGYAPYDNPKMSIMVTSPDSSHPNSNIDYASLVTYRITQRVTEKYSEMYGY